MRKRYIVLVCCLMISMLFIGCQRRLAPGGQPDGKNPNISAAKDRADSYQAVVTSDTKAQTGMNGGTPVTYNVRSGSAVRIIGRYDGYYVAVLPNNQVGLVPINSTRPATPSPSRALTPPPAGGAGGGTNMMPGGTTGGQTGTTPGGTTGGQTGTTPGDTAGGKTGTVPGGGTTGSRFGVPPAGTAGGQTTEAPTMVNLVNQARSQAGLKVLSSNADLTNLAGMKATDIVSKNYFSHTSPTYGSPFDMMKKYGVSYLYAGENLARDQNVQSAEQALMNSTEHKANILNPNFTDIGIGIAQRSDGSKIYVQMFIGK